MAVPGGDESVCARLGFARTRDSIRLTRDQLDSFERIFGVRALKISGGKDLVAQSRFDFAVLSFETPETRRPAVCTTFAAIESERFYIMSSPGACKFTIRQ